MIYLKKPFVNPIGNNILIKFVLTEKQVETEYPITKDNLCNTTSDENLNNPDFKASWTFEEGIEHGSFTRILFSRLAKLDLVNCEILKVGNTELSFLEGKKGLLDKDSSFAGIKFFVDLKENTLYSIIMERNLTGYYNHKELKTIGNNVLLKINKEDGWAEIYNALLNKHIDVKNEHAVLKGMQTHLAQFKVNNNIAEVVEVGEKSSIVKGSFALIEPIPFLFSLANVVKIDIDKALYFIQPDNVCKAIIEKTSIEDVQSNSK